METFAARLESFNAIHPGTKKRTSNAKGAAKLKWPHETPNPAQLAKAGFYYNPKASTPDNTTCYLCHTSLDGWEEDDNPIREHSNLSPDCGWAAIARIEQNIEDGADEQDNPMNETLLDARRMTFGANWPHENKRGWTCKIEKHQRRSPDCTFFALAASKKQKPVRGKKGRASQASRMSTQSNVTAATDDFSMLDVNSIADASLMQGTESVSISKATKGGKKGAKGRKVAPKSKRKASTAVQEEAANGSSFVGPEDDDFEIKVESKATHHGQGKKRKSDEMSVDNDTSPSEPKLEQPQPQLPPSKRQTTRSSVSHAIPTPISTLEFTLDDDTQMQDSEDIPAPDQPTSKKTARGGRKRASSSARKASTASTASKASLRATAPKDEEIDAALEADLDRPLTDDEGDVEPPPLPKIKTRRLTKTRPGSRKVTASTAPVRRATRASALPLEGDSMTSTDAPAYELGNDSLEQTKAVEIALNAIDHAKQEIIAETDKQIASKTKARGRPPSKLAKSAKANSQAVDEEPVPLTQRTAESESARRIDQLPEQSPRIWEVSGAGIVMNETAKISSSVLAPTTAVDESENAEGADTRSQNHGKKGGKKTTATTTKKAKGNRKGATTESKKEDVVHVELEDPRRNSHEPVVGSEIPEDQKSVEETPLFDPATVSETPDTEDKAPKSKKGRSTKVKAKTKKPTLGIASTEVTEPCEDTSMILGKEGDAVAEKPLVNDTEQNNDDAKSSEAATPPKKAQSVHETMKTTVTPQSSDVENQPPSARPSALRPPLSTQSPSKGQNPRVLPGAITPMVSPSKHNISHLQSTLPWATIDFEQLFTTSPAAAKDNFPVAGSKEAKETLTSPEKKLTVEEWIRWNAKRGEDKLRNDCERLVGRFEGEGVRALKTLEGIVCAD
ncbi:MAG: hypothetical protein Q9186_006136 [Xanthomendoza sp. 1 TL-2023]